MATTIDLYEGNGGQLFLVRNDSEQAIVIDIPSSDFRTDCRHWNDWVGDSGNETVATDTLMPDWAPLVATWHGPTASVKIHSTLGGAARAYLGSDAPASL